MADPGRPVARYKLTRLGSNLLSVFFAIVTIAVAIGGLLDTRDSLTRFPADPTRDKLNEIATQQVRLEKSILELRSRLEALGKSQSNGATAPAQINALTSSVEELEQRFSRIEEAIIQDPAKALEVPILRKDLEKAQELTLAQVNSLRQDIERTYSLITGTMIALALAVLAPALSGLFKRERGNVEG